MNNRGTEKRGRRGWAAIQQEYRIPFPDERPAYPLTAEEFSILMEGQPMPMEQNLRDICISIAASALFFVLQLCLTTTLIRHNGRVNTAVLVCWVADLVLLIASLVVVIFLVAKLRKNAKRQLYTKLCERIKGQLGE